jgi:hypothetical protein
MITKWNKNINVGQTRSLNAAKIYKLKGVGGWKIKMRWFSMKKIKTLTCANKQRLIIAMGEWHHEAYKDTNKFLPAGSTSECFKRSRSSDNSEDVSKIKFNAWNKKKSIKWINKNSPHLSG